MIGQVHLNQRQIGIDLLQGAFDSLPLPSDGIADERCIDLLIFPIINWFM